MVQKYRADIDGLRAIAIISVIAFHAFPARLPGGFVGVDVFFVISGYLISKIIIEAVESNAFSYFEFYSRRARRILPALFAVTVICLSVGFLVLNPDDLKQMAESAIASTAFAANVYFYKTSNYFTNNDTLPLLHYWSLGVEEQFYVAFPILIALVWRSGAHMIVILIAVFLLSLCMSEYLLGSNPTASFYLLSSRAWELLTGTLTFLISRRCVIRSHIAGFISLVGLIAIIASTLLLTKYSTFPGIHALPSCLGTALVIWSGVAVSTPTHAALGSVFPRTVGKISYSLYLIHWPALVFAAMLWPSSREGVRGALVLLFSAGLAGISFYWIETPFRRYFRAPPVKVLRMAVIPVAILAVTGSAIVLADGFPGRFDPLVWKYAAYAKYDDVEQFGGACFLDDGQKFEQLKQSCFAPPGAKSVVLWGDSGAAQYSFELRRRFAKAGYYMAQFTMSACPPLLGASIAPRPYCKPFNEKVLAAILKSRPKAVIIDWATWGDTDVPPHLRETIKALSDANLFVVLLGPSPRFSEEIPNLLANRIKAGNRDFYASKDLISLSYIRNMEAVLATAARGHKNVVFFPMFDSACPSEKCLLVASNIPAYKDRFHTTAAGAAMQMDRVFNGLMEVISQRR